MPTRSLTVTLLLLLATAGTTPSPAAAAGIALPGYESKGGDVDVPYPFGTSDGCHRAGFKITCDRAQQPPKLFLGANGGGGPEVSLRNSTVRDRGAVWSFAADTTGTVTVDVLPVASGLRRRYVLSAARNSLVIVGCGFQATVARRGDAAAFASCAPLCPGAAKRKLRHGPCDGAGCCELPVPTGLAVTAFDVRFSWLEQNATARPAWVVPGANVLVVEQEWWRDRDNLVPVKLSLLNSGNATARRPARRPRRPGAACGGRDPAGAEGGGSGSGGLCVGGESKKETIDGTHK